MLMTDEGRCIAWIGGAHCMRVFLRISGVICSVFFLLVSRLLWSGRDSFDKTLDGNRRRRWP